MSPWQKRSNKQDQQRRIQNTLYDVDKDTEEVLKWRHTKQFMTHSAFLWY